MNYGLLKLTVANQLTKAKCQEIHMLLGIAPAVCERTCSGLELLNELESMGHFSETNLDPLKRTLRLVNLMSAVAVLDGYRP